MVKMPKQQTAADDIPIMFFLQEDKPWHFILIVCSADVSHETGRTN